MKTYRNLYPLVHDFENLFLAYQAAKKGKSSKAPVAAFMRRREDEIFLLQEELRHKTYAPGPYDSFWLMCKPGALVRCPSPLFFAGYSLDAENSVF
ncbi:MAG: hypothetical protein ACOY0R_21755 [Chloroflexota bacterium]